jgi:hypothetical protein
MGAYNAEYQHQYYLAHRGLSRRRVEGNPMHDPSVRAEMSQLKTRHGHTRNDGYMSPTYNSWRAMKERCLSQTYKQWAGYGGRGVSIAPSWLTFDGFLADMGERPDNTTLDRIDPDGNYGPDNCRWADRLIQRANRRSRKAG